jgi:hypothetical protein
MKKIIAVMIGLCLQMTPAARAQTTKAEPAAKQVVGTISSFDGANTLVVANEINGKRELTTFVLNADTRKAGELKKGADATVQYIVNGKRNIATLVQASDPDLETLDYAKSMISLDGAAKAHVTSGNNIVVEGSATSHDKFQHDVFLTATLWDANDKSVGTASGRLEDLPAGHQGNYRLVGTTTSPTWARVSVVVSNVTEHVRKESQ